MGFYQFLHIGSSMLLFPYNIQKKKKKKHRHFYYYCVLWDKDHWAWLNCLFFLFIFVHFSVGKTTRGLLNICGENKFPIKWYCLNISTDILKNHWSKLRQWVSSKITFLKVSSGFVKMLCGKIILHCTKSAQFPANLVTFTEEILYGKLLLWCSFR